MADIKNHSTLATSLVQYFDLEEASGTRYNLVGSTNLSDGNTVGQATGKIGNCATFDGVNEYLEYPSSSDFVLSGAAARSLSFWFKANDTTGTQVIASAWGSGTAQNWIVYMVGSSLRFGAEQNSNLFSTTVASGTWYHVIFLAKSDGSYQGYVNGSSVGTGTPSGTAAAAVVMRLGAQSTGANAFQGEIEEFGWWQKELSTSEISDLYNSGNGLPYYDPEDIANDTTLSTSLVSYWELEESTGDRVDSKGSNDLSEVNSVTNTTGKVGNAADFVKTNNEFLKITNASQSGLNGATTKSFAGWFYLDSFDTYLFSKDDNTTGDREYAASTSSSDSKMYLTYWDSSGNKTEFNTANTFSTGQWYHLAFIIKNGASDSADIYVNGVLQTGSTVATAAGTINSTGTADFYLSGRAVGGGQFGWDGWIDEFGVWNKALSIGEVRALYGYGTPPVYSAGGGGGSRRVFIIS